MPLQLDRRDKQGIDRAEICPVAYRVFTALRLAAKGSKGHPPLLSPKGDHRSKIDGHN
jgi:hypothetical protein